MNTDQFRKERQLLKDSLDAYKKTIDKQYQEICKSFIEANSPVESGKVYVLKKNGIQRRGFKRVVIYAQEVSVFDVHPYIQVGGWWIDTENNLVKWENWIVFGSANNTVFELAEDQLYHPHAEEKEAAE